MVFGAIVNSITSPLRQPQQQSNTEAAAPGFASIPGCTALVTGSSGLCGARLVEMLLERGASTVICFDVTPPDSVLKERSQAVQESTNGKLIVLSGTEGDITNADSVNAAFEKVPQIDVVYHIAALVGPFHDRSKYEAVNYTGTLYVLDACKKYKVPKLVFSSSPSTRFTGADIDGLREDELPIPDTFLALYAETKAQAEKAVAAACDNDTLLTVSVAPHQVYGPYDSLFFPKLMETAGTGRLRIFGPGDNRISVCYVDNYCHGLMCGADALEKDSPALGKFYIITDTTPVYFWKIINQAAVQLGFADLEKKAHLPVWFLYIVAYIANVVGFIIGKKLKLNPFNVRMLTMNRYFSPELSERDLKYKPLYEFQERWQYTIDWFKEHWLPGFLASQQGNDKKSN
jgi:nucleoside-diphosphate-sugar epimerase